MRAYWNMNDNILYRSRLSGDRDTRHGHNRPAKVYRPEAFLES